MSANKYFQVKSFISVEFNVLLTPWSLFHVAFDFPFLLRDRWILFNFRVKLRLRNKTFSLRHFSGIWHEANHFALGSCYKALCIDTCIAPRFFAVVAVFSLSQFSSLRLFSLEFGLTVTVTMCQNLADD